MNGFLIINAMSITRRRYVGDVLRRDSPGDVDPHNSPASKVSTGSALLFTEAR